MRLIRSTNSGAGRIAVADALAVSDAAADRAACVSGDEVVAAGGSQRGIEEDSENSAISAARDRASSHPPLGLSAADRPRLDSKGGCLHYPPPFVFFPLKSPVPYWCLDLDSAAMNLITLALVLVHAAVLLGHDYAHKDLVVKLVLWQTVFAYSVIVAAPLIASGLTFTGNARAGYALLTASMLGALAFGFYHHYVLISADHVDHLPHGETQGLFRTTAELMVALEFAGAALGTLGWWRSAKPAQVD
jgi:hypothetical protein